MSTSIKQAFDIFMNDRETFCAPKTLIYYKDNLNQFFSFIKNHYGFDIENIDMNDLPNTAFGDYVKYLRQRDCFENHPFTPSTGHKIKNSTIRTYSRAVKVFIGFCKSEELLESNLKITKLPKDDAKQVVPLYSSEVEKIDSLFNDRTEFGLRNFCIIHLMLDAGLRSSEVVNLKLSNLLFDKNVIVVEDSKYNKSRVVLMCPRLKSRLYKYCILHRSYNADSLEIGKQKVFMQIRGQEYINLNVIKQFFARLKRKTGIERLHPHLLRHTFATSYIMGGGNLEMLRLLLGHYDYNVTRNYLHLANQYMMLNADIYKLDSVFFKTTY